MAMTALRPEASIFGQPQQAYLHKLMSGTGDSTADALNQIALMLHARSDNGVGNYMSALRDANDAQERASYSSDNADVAKAYFPAAAPMAKEGISGAVLPNADNPYLRVDPRRLTGADALHQQNIQSDTVKNVGAGVKDLAEAGMAPPPKEVGGMITPYLQQSQTPVDNYLSPGNKALETNADAHMLDAEAAMFNAKHGGPNRNNGNGDKTVTTLIPDGKGGLIPIAVVRTDKGSDAAPAKADEKGDKGTPAKGHWERDPKTNRAKWVSTAEAAKK